jgi:hypothetical protein
MSYALTLDVPENVYEMLLKIAALGNAQKH